MTRLPMPDWTREGETWRVEEERHLLALNVTGVRCSSRGCDRGAVAISKLASRLALCPRHLAELSIWVEDGRVVSWCLRP